MDDRYHDRARCYRADLPVLEYPDQRCCHPGLQQFFSPAQQTSLSQSLPTGITGSDLVEWSKGTNKTGLKARSVLLGDIINSPLVLAAPTDQTASDLVGDTSYSTYLATKAANMNASLVVNANDGFVNVINSTNGVRRYGYMPSNVLPSLHYIADPTYINGVSHKFFWSTVRSVCSMLNLIAPGKTLAIGGTGAGGKNVLCAAIVRRIGR